MGGRVRVEDKEQRKKIEGGDSEHMRELKKRGQESEEEWEEVKVKVDGP